MPNLPTHLNFALEVSNRLDSPLIKASDAIEVDTTNLTVEEQTRKILNIIKRKINDRKYN